ncbi:hypothetical protein, partial [Bifidobacterium vespertilionis]|uniref:hypothetical protein n=1 Tax=Bifidobacterium vespertilionis TaxID=2562524 RepID=UPI001BDDB28D
MINLVRHKTFKIYTDENTFTNGQIPQLYYNSLNSIGLGLISPINRSISDSTVRFKMEIHQQILNKINWINSFTVD